MDGEEVTGKKDKGVDSWKRNEIKKKRNSGVEYVNEKQNVVAAKTPPKQVRIPKYYLTLYC